MEAERDMGSRLPEITDGEIDHVCSLMGIADFDEPRCTFLKRRDTVDVSACPGAGKTTLVVAKLAMLAQKWPYRTSGICVLSHTNVAREQIEQRLSNTEVGPRLLDYPHYVGTIQGFVDQFLALPWLYSRGYPAVTVDDDLTTMRRKRALGQGIHVVQGCLDRRHKSFDGLRIYDRNMEFVLDGKPFPAGVTTRSYKLTKRAVETAANDGYFCYDEMFVWAKSLLEDQPELPDWLAQRFPLVILDEVQDTSPTQGDLLDKLFPRDSTQVVVQRVGDPNQRIFSHDAAESGNTGGFPDPERHALTLPNSFRFGRIIAAMASPFAVVPVGDSGLCGMGGATLDGPDEERAGAIFVFPDDDTSGVLDAFGSYVIDTLGLPRAIEGPVWAVGDIVHRRDDEPQPGDPKFPRTVGDYWNGYKDKLAGLEPRPDRLVQYVRLGQALTKDGASLFPGVEKIASGLVELGRRMGKKIGGSSRGTRAHRNIVEVIEGNITAMDCYRALLYDFLVARERPSEADWRGRKDGLVAAAHVLGGNGELTERARNFLQWRDDPVISGGGHKAEGASALNVYPYTNAQGRVDIQLGSIHSVKGQTHLATLVLSTYWCKHWDVRVLPWLVGDKVNRDRAGSQDIQRLLRMYVAMTRPSHLLCIALRQSSLGSDAIRGQNIAKLKKQGWIAELVNGVAVWA